MDRLLDRVDGMLSEIGQLESQLDKMADAGAVDIDQMIADADNVEGVQLIVLELPGVNPAVMRQLIDQIRKKTGPVPVFFATSPGPEKVLLAAGISRELVDNGYSAGDWIKEVAPIVGGGGGGKPDLAQAGGKKPEKIGSAIESARQYIKNKALEAG
jgi:alanyl-tRNA synthetase